MGREGANGAFRSFRGCLPQGGAHASGHAGLMVREGIEEGGDDHVAGDPAQGIEVDLHRDGS